MEMALYVKIIGRTGLSVRIVKTLMNRLMIYIIGLLTVVFYLIKMLLDSIVNKLEDIGDCCEEREQ